MIDNRLYRQKLPPPPQKGISKWLLCALMGEYRRVHCIFKTTLVCGFQNIITNG